MPLLVRQHPYTARRLCTDGDDSLHMKASLPISMKTFLTLLKSANSTDCVAGHLCKTNLLPFSIQACLSALGHT